MVWGASAASCSACAMGGGSFHAKTNPMHQKNVSKALQ